MNTQADPVPAAILVVYTALVCLLVLIGRLLS
jgi:hypothetical protein